MKLEDIKPQMRVAYVPMYDPDALEYGTVSSVNSKYAFVRFDAQVKKLGWDGATSHSCHRDDLIAAPNS